MNINEIIHGFQIESIRKSEELGGTLYEMRHLQSGALLAYLDNGEENKLFSIAFKTLPWDDTGVFHILEHSVLAGSEHFPVKEPFLDLLKSSMNTFLNAMTFPDKTVYPVSSKNEQDFMNLVEVYLDAVFCPSIYHNESIFRQEGWHYELQEGKPVYNGVVFNEMKGALSSLDGRMGTVLEKALFPQSIYGFVSGGDPKVIPDLTYQDFLRAHREFYAPSNAKIYLDGAVPLERVLTLLDETYLSRFEKIEQSHDIALQAPIVACDITEYYEIGKEESEENKTQIVFGKVFADWSERKRITAMRLLFAYLGGTNESPLCRAVLEKGLAQNVELAVADEIAQPFYYIVFRNTEAANKEMLKAVYEQTLRQILENGIDKDELEACLNKLEFSMRELEEPQGLVRNCNALNAWLYDGDILLWMENESLLQDLRAAIQTDYYASLLEELLDFSATAFLTMLPSATKGEEDSRAEEERVTAEYAAFSEAERMQVQQIYDAMRVWQDTPDTPGAMASLPTLSLSDVDGAPQWTKTEKEVQNGITLLYHPIASHGLVHGTLYFNVADQTPEDFMKLSFMCELLGVLPTKRHSAADLQKEIKKNIGALRFAPEIMPDLKDPKRTKAALAVSFSVLEDKLPAALALIKEILRETVYDNRALIRENLLQCSEMLYQEIIGMGHQFAFRHALSHASAAFAVRECTEGYAFYCYVKQFAAHFEEEIEAFIAFVETASDIVFSAGRLTISQTATQKQAAALWDFAAQLPAGKAVQETLTLPPQAPAKEIILIPAGVSYAAYAGNILPYGYAYQGKFSAVAMLLTYGYLWNEIRVHGGAYGCGFRPSLSGNLSFHSYRDPNPLQSLEVYRQTSTFLRDFARGEETLDKFIISGIAAMEGLQSVAKQGCQADLDYFSGVTYEDALHRRADLMAAKKEDLISLCPMFDAMQEGNSICIVGNEQALASLGEEWERHRL